MSSAISFDTGVEIARLDKALRPLLCLSSLGLVERCVFSLRKYGEIFWSIVFSVVIDMMHNLVFSEKSTQGGFCYDDVLKYISIPIGPGMIFSGDIHIPAVNSSSAFPRLMILPANHSGVVAVNKPVGFLSYLFAASTCAKYVFAHIGYYTMSYGVD